MALTKRTYVDGETIITAQNLNDIQDEIISHGNTFVPKTRTVNGKALSSNITLSASNVGAVPTTRTVNGKALSSNIELSAADVGAPTKNHYSQTTNYGLGTDAGYGHLKLSDSSSSTSDTSGGIAATPKAVMYANELVTVVESGSTATRSYSTGDYVIVNGRLWRVTDDISSGQNFNTSTNITRVYACSEIKTALTETIPITRGGTGGTSLAEAKENFGFGSLTSGIVSLLANATTTINVPNNARTFLIAFGSAGFMVSVNVSSSGGVSYQEYWKASTISFSTGTRQLIVSNTSTANLTCGWMDFLGRTITV